MNLVGECEPRALAILVHLFFVVAVCWQL
jgi:hypothetical protein